MKFELEATKILSCDDHYVDHPRCLTFAITQGREKK